MINKLTLEKIQIDCSAHHAQLIAVTKTHPVDVLQDAYNVGLRHFGENKVQEMESKSPLLPNDIQWHLIGHLQSNKVKYIAPYVHLIHSVDSLKLLHEINKEAGKQNRIIPVLLQVHIAEEETKFGLDSSELHTLCASNELYNFNNVRIQGLMGMATFTDDKNQIRSEFKSLRRLFESCQTQFKGGLFNWKDVSMGMTSDYQIALEEGSTMIRVGSAIFGHR
ncbi:MAG: YggS family pyridoxal phosphate-dependent enzyme [Cytophagaceae bacterium]